ncbi:MAG: metallophosphoesterase [Candidatus Aminicenantes bacterium]|nr:metallophosphoesterase [Candidatus Aminicenantes bacterium]
MAVGDLHGAYDNFVVILKDTGLVDDNLNWIGGETHLVQIGDVLDRGDKPKEIFNLAMRLEKEAEAAGGKVHILIGNHEEMNLANTAFDREGYITPAQFQDFLPENYILKQENKFRKRSGSKSSDSDGDYNKYWKEIIDKCMGEPSSAARMTYMRTLNILYGDWIIGNNVIIKINDIVFVHGGISENFSHRTLKDINETYRRELDDIRTAVVRNQQPKIPVYDRELFNREDGPLWYRGMAVEESEEFRDDIERILTNLQANHVVIAHTPRTRQGIDEMRKYEGKVWVIDTGIAEYYKPIGGHLSALIIENGKFSVSYPVSEQKISYINSNEKGGE